MYVMLAEAMVDDTIALTQSWRPDIIVSEPTTYAGPLAAAMASGMLWAVQIRS